MTYLVFVRHGEALGAEGRCVGHTNLPLSPAGVRAITDLASSWCDSSDTMRIGAPTRIISSDLRRAVASAELLAIPWGISVEYDPLLREMHFGEWDGQPWQLIEAEDAQRFYAWMNQWTDVRAPGGEGVHDVARRASDTLQNILSTASCSSNAAITIVIVSHAGWIRAALSQLLRRSLSTMFDLPVDYAHATIVRIGPTESSLLASNVIRLL